MPPFDYFVVFAEMRTGSNFLEANINAFDGLQCHGEAFNPHFIGYPNQTEILGVTQAQREADPKRLIDKIRKGSKGIGGFRFFNDHDPRVLDIALPDPRCAKVILTRNPIESYVSWKIAKATGQWKLTNVKHARSETVPFDPAEFEDHLSALQGFQIRLLNNLQRVGQTAFYVDYEDLQDVDVMNGLAAYLGCPNRIDGLDKKLKKQNPDPMAAKVINYAEMENALARLDRFNLARTPNFEPRRAPVIPTYLAAPDSPLMYLPIKGGPENVVAEWLAGLDGRGIDELQKSFSQKTLRQWKRTHVGHRSFTVLRHPVSRTHAVFCDYVLSVGPGSYLDIRETLRKVFKLPIPKDAPGPQYDRAAHRTAFLAFLTFLKANLAAQTSIRVDGTWATQAAVLQGLAGFAPPDLVLREDRLREDLAILAAQIGKTTMPDLPAVTDPHAERLASIYDDEIEAAVRDAYQRDYMTFGFGDWKSA
jgi:hypothetical protein